MCGVDDFGTVVSSTDNSFKTVFILLCLASKQLYAYLSNCRNKTKSYNVDQQQRPCELLVKSGASDHGDVEAGLRPLCYFRLPPCGVILATCFAGNFGQVWQ